MSGNRSFGFRGREVSAGEGFQEQIRIAAGVIGIAAIVIGFFFAGKLFFAIKGGLEHPDEIRAREESAIMAMFDALMLTGVAMTMVGTSAPASGGEHLISHSLDMLSSIDGRPHDYHGRQVGIGAILTAELYSRVLAVESPLMVDVPASTNRSQAKES